jgi:SOS-response transcriptional repressor LexA
MDKTPDLTDPFILPRLTLGDVDQATTRLVEIRDNAMRGVCDSGIVLGDWVAIRPQSTAGDGDIVAVMADGELVVRQFRVCVDYICFDVDNCDGIGDAYFPDEGATIVGKVVAIIHRT